MRFNIVFFLLIGVLFQCKCQNRSTELIKVENEYFKREVFVVENNSIISFKSLNSILRSESKKLRGKKYDIIKNIITDYNNIDIVSIYPYSLNNLSESIYILGFYFESDLGGRIYFLPVCKDGSVGETFYIQEGISILEDQTDDKEIVSSLNEVLVIKNSTFIHKRVIKILSEQYFKNDSVFIKSRDTMFNTINVRL